MDNRIENYCQETESINKVLDFYKKEFLDNYEFLEVEERKPVLKAMPYCYRIWYYSALISDTSLSPANFINMQIKEKFNEDLVVVPIARPVYTRKKLKDFQQDFVIFTVEDHPVLKDLEYFLDNCRPDIGVDASGLLLDDEREAIIYSLTFKEIFYVTFLTNTAYELGLLKKMPSIGVHRATAVTSNMEVFFNLTKREQLKRLVEAVISIASKQMCDLFPLDRSSFSVSSLRNMIKDAVDLNEYLNNIMEKYNIIVDMDELEKIDLENLDDIEIDNLPQESMMALAIRMELAFAMDAYIATPLGYYLQLLQPIYINTYDAATHFYELYQAEHSKVPLIKLFFMMPNGLDLTDLGENIILDGKKAKNKFQALKTKIDFKQTFEDIYEYQTSIVVDDWFDIVEEPEIDIATAYFNGKAARKVNSKDELNIPAADNEEVVTNRNRAYIFKIKNTAHKRKYITIEVKGSQTMSQICDIVKNSYKLEDGHLYSFFMNNKPFDREYEIPCLEEIDSDIRAVDVKLYDLRLIIGQKFLLIYNFDKKITFEIDFLGTEALEKGANYPRIVENRK
jgi:hypothetical protein